MPARTARALTPGRFIQKLRKEQRITLRKFCRTMGFCPLRWSRIERNLQKGYFTQRDRLKLFHLLRLSPPEIEKLLSLQNEQKRLPLENECPDTPLFFCSRQSGYGALKRLPEWMPPSLTIGALESLARRFRKKHFPGWFPLDIESAIEFELGLELVPLAAIDQVPGGEAFLNIDCTALYIDRELYLNPRKRGRLRFVLAHELGHLACHRNPPMPPDVRSPENRVQFLIEMPEAALRRLEWQANCFAAILLIPRAALEKALRHQLRTWRAEDPEVSPFHLFHEKFLPEICRKTAPRFGVTPRVLQLRIEAEGLWPPDPCLFGLL